jgi:AmiR/NasT family two-component response regulator
VLRILLFEESHDRAGLVREDFARAGLEVVATIHSPLELLPAIEHSRPDLVVMGVAHAHALAADLADVHLKLRERTIVERAKGLLMQQRGLGEDEAYHALRRLAMQKKLRLGEIAEQLLNAAELLGKR